MGGGMTLIAPLPVAEAADQIFEKALKKLSPNNLQPFTSPAQSVATAPN
jgi:hypothetical protein